MRASVEYAVVKVQRVVLIFYHDRSTAVNKNDRIALQNQLCGFILVSRQLVQPTLNILDAMFNVSAQAGDGRLILIFPRFVLGKHTEEQVDIQRCSDALLEGYLKNGCQRNIHNNVSPFDK